MRDMGWHALQSCEDISAQDAEEAAHSVAEMRAFLVRVAEIARPDAGAPKLLAAIARLSAQPWLDAELHIELVGDDRRTFLSIYYQGGGLRERMLPQIEMAVPVDEFVCQALVSPHFAAPLQVVVADDRLTLRMPRRVTEAPPTVRLPIPNPSNRATADDDSEAGEDQLGKTAPPPSPSANRPSGLIVPGPDPTLSPEVYTKTTVPRMAVVDPRQLVPHRDPRREDDE